MDFKGEQVRQFITQCLAEDIGSGDYSTLSCIDASTTGKAHLLFKEKGIVAGLELAETILTMLDSSMKISFLKKDGDKVQKGETGMLAEGRVHALLSGERLMLNCMQRLSGIATYTRKLADMIAHTNARLLDTRKTTPGLRFLEKWAVTVGGGYNHRIGLYDMVMLKDNHIDYAGGITNALNQSAAYLKQNNLNLAIEVETRNLAEVQEVLDNGLANRVMFDNFSPALMREAVLLVNGRLETEASGGINENNIVTYAETGVDFISVGALTHSVKSLDISFKEG